MIFSLRFSTDRINETCGEMMEKSSKSDGNKKPCEDHPDAESQDDLRKVDALPEI
jgi:hypothetical protein